MRKRELLEAAAVACASPGSLLQSDGEAKGELPAAAVRQNEDGSDQQTRSCEQPAALSGVIPTASKVDSESGTGTELRAVARVLLEASAVQAQQQPMPAACAAPLDTATLRMEVSAAASTLQNLSAVQPEECEPVLPESTGGPNTAGPSQPGPIASRAQPAYEDGGATPETIAAVNEMYHLNTPYEVGLPLQYILLIYKENTSLHLQVFWVISAACGFSLKDCVCRLMQEQRRLGRRG